MVRTQQSSVEALTLKVEDLLRLVETGKVRVPNFQRPLRWKAKDNLLLLDSILRGYPIGSLLVWRREAKADRLSFGGVAIDAPAHADGWWVVDGQQRITALAGALLGTAPRESGFQFSVDAKTGDIRSAARRTESDIPLEVLASAERLIPWLHAHPQVDSKAASVLSKRLREYPLPVTILISDDEDFAKQVFKRLNASGKPLKQTEIFRALHAGRPAVHSLNSARRMGERLDFGQIDDEALVRAFKFLAGHDPLAETPLLDTAATVFDLEAATEAAVQFFKRTARIPRANLMPYMLPMGILIAFFALHPHSSERNRTLLSYWLWRGIVQHRFAGDFTSIRRYFQAIHDVGESEAVQALLATVSREWPSPVVDMTASYRTADGKVVRLAMLAAGPLDLRDGSAVDSLHLEPTVLFRNVEHPLAKGVVNRIIHPAVPPKVLHSLIAEADAVRRASHFFPPVDPQEPITFLEQRRVLLQRGVDEFVARATGQFETLRPPLNVLLGVAE